MRETIIPSSLIVRSTIFPFRLRSMFISLNIECVEFVILNVCHPNRGVIVFRDKFMKSQTMHQTLNFFYMIYDSRYCPYGQLLILN